MLCKQLYCKSTIGERGIWGSGREHPVRFLHPRLRVPDASMRRTTDQGLRLGIISGTLRFKSLIFQYLLLLARKSLNTVIQLSEREGFEPSVPFRVHTTSNRAPSAARSSLQNNAPVPGAGGIRTPGTLTSSMVFETISFNRSDTAPKWLPFAPLL